mgnify:CR=1 FL=1
MSVKKFYATADTTITNAYKENMKIRGTDANMGLSDSLETFFIFGQTVDPQALLADKLEEARILLKFDTDAIINHYGSFPSNVKFVLKLTNAEHPFTLARNYDLKVYHLANSFIEGNGLDMESYRDEGPASWTNRAVSTPWTVAGGLEAGVTEIATQRFDTGEENLEVDITGYIEDIFEGTIPSDNGLIITMDGTLTDGSQEQNFYTKKFFSRSSEFFFKRPVIEARDSNTNSDDRGKFYRASPFVASNEQNIYLYNSIDGERTDITGTVALELFEDEAMTTSITTGVVTKVKTGIYKAEVTVPNTVTVSTIYEKWTSDENVIRTGSIDLLTRQPTTDDGVKEYVTNITNLKTSYTRQETAKFRVYTRQKDWNPTIYTVASKEIENLIVEKMYYKIVRLVDEEIVLDYGIGTNTTNNNHTLVSYDALGSYFDFDMSLLEKGYMYGIKLLFSVNGELREQEEIFKFRVD